MIFLHNERNMNLDTNLQFEIKYYTNTCESLGNISYLQRAEKL